ncbi:MAG TPA: GntR family transcriptional regulator [Gaiellaceae bacterium]|jgi:DNA-binding GntR family transcriptional regulator
MPLTKIRLPRRGPRAQELYEFLRTAILEGKLLPDERLVELEVARLSGVSRTPVREAIRKLEADGLVEQTTAGMRVTVMSAREVRDLCAVREHLEGMAGRVAAGTRSDIDLRHLERLVDAFDEAVETGNLDEIVSLNRAFHQAVWEITGNQYLAALLADLVHRIEGLQGTTLTSLERQQETAREHREFLTAIRDRDEEAAEQLGRLHFREAMALRLAMFDRPVATRPNGSRRDVH